MHKHNSRITLIIYSQNSTILTFIVKFVYTHQDYLVYLISDNERFRSKVLGPVGKGNFNVIKKISIMLWKVTASSVQVTTLWEKNDLTSQRGKGHNHIIIRKTKLKWMNNQELKQSCNYTIMSTCQISAGAKISFDTIHLKPKWKLYNGVTGTIVDFFYDTITRPTEVHKHVLQIFFNTEIPYFKVLPNVLLRNVLDATVSTCV